MYIEASNKEQKKSIAYYIFFMTMICSFFSFKIFSINITYFLGIMVFYLSLPLLRKINYSVIYIFFFGAVIFVSQCMGLYYFKENYTSDINIQTPILYLYSILISFGIAISFHKLSQKERLIIYKKSLKMAIIFFLIELVLRIFSANWGLGIIYGLKNSWFYFDSNFTGIVIMSVLSFYLYLKKRKIYLFSNKQKYLLVLLVIFTASRAAIFSTLIILIIDYFSKSKYRFNFISLLTWIIFLFASYLMVNYFSSGENFLDVDGSFNSKFSFLMYGLDMRDYMNMQNYLFGIGLGNLQKISGFFAHNIFLTLLVETGSIGTILFIAIVILSLKKTNGWSNYIWLPVLVAGFSLFSAYLPFLFIYITLIYYNEKNYRSIYKI